MLGAPPPPPPVDLNPPLLAPPRDPDVDDDVIGDQLPIGPLSDPPLYPVLVPKPPLPPPFIIATGEANPLPPPPPRLEPPLDDDDEVGRFFVPPCCKLCPTLIDKNINMVVVEMVDIRVKNRAILDDY